MTGGGRRLALGAAIAMVVAGLASLVLQTREDLPEAREISAEAGIGGHGESFRQVPIPQTLEGKADAVVSIDHDGNGRSAFIVMNGKNKARGPIRLIAFR